MTVTVVWLRDYGRLVRYELEDPEQDDEEEQYEELVAALRRV